jgi:4-amino-4-deoxy-L-arabinose transferase-like glycosyltransferase
VGHAPRLLFYLQALLSCLTALLLYGVAGRRFGRRGALYAASAWLFLPGAILSSALFNTTTLFTFLWILSLALYDRLQNRGFRYRDAAGLGLAVGLTALTRTTGLFLLLALAVYLLFIRYEPWRGTEWRGALLTLLCAALVLVPWAARNALVTGRFVLNTNSGMAMFLDRAPDMETAVPPTPHLMLPDQAAGNDDAILIERQPFATVALWVRKCVRVWATDLGLWVRYSLRSTPAQAVAELRGVPLLPLLIASFPTLLLAGIGLSGFCLVRRFPSRGLYLLQIGTVLAALFFTYGVPRDVIPFLPALVVGGAALFRLHPWRYLPLWQRALHGLVLTALAGVWLLAALTIARW